MKYWGVELSELEVRHGDDGDSPLVQTLGNR
jgi:hypothetical protein